MKRIKFAIIILAAVVVVAAGIFLTAYYFNDKAEKKEKAEADKLVMFNFDDDDVEKIEINNDGGQFIAEYIDNKGWALTNTDEFQVNDALIAAIAANMCELKATKILEDEDPSKYGFDTATKVTCHIGDEAHTVIVGNSSPTYESFYAMKENDDNIYLIEFSKGSILAADKNALKQTYLYTYMFYDIDHFALWNGKQTDENVLFSMNKDSNDKWSMEKPEKDNSVLDTQINKFLTDASKDQVSSFVQEGCDESEYSKFGFDNPQYVLEVSAKGETTTIIFGAPTGNENEIYGLFIESGQVVTFVSNEIASLGYTTLDMMNTSVFSTDISNVATVTVNVNGKEITLDMSEGENAYKANNINVCEISEQAKSAFITFFNSFNNAYFESVERAATPSGEPAITIKYVQTNNIVTELEYIPIENSNEYYAMKNGEYTGYTITDTIVEAITSSCDTLIGIIE